MPKFALVTEGKTDLYVIENIITGFLDDLDVFITDLSPIRDETDLNRVENYSNWLKVFEYCKSEKFKDAFGYNDYVIVQIDTDVSDEKGFDVSKFENNKEFSPQELVNKVKEKFVSLIGEGFFNQYQEKIIFAICVHSMECWLLPIYCDKKSTSKSKGCAKTLNGCLAKKNLSQIGQNNKDPRQYELLSKDYTKHKRLMALYKMNPSLEIFIDELILRFPQTEKF